MQPFILFHFTSLVRSHCVRMIIKKLVWNSPSISHDVRCPILDSPGRASRHYRHAIQQNTQRDTRHGQFGWLGRLWIRSRGQRRTFEFWRPTSSFLLRWTSTSRLGTPHKCYTQPRPFTSNYYLQIKKNYYIFFESFLLLLPVPLKNIKILFKNEQASGKISWEILLHAIL